MNGMNRVILIGHIGSDPEVRSTASGKRVVRLKCGDPFVLGRGGDEAIALADRIMVMKNGVVVAEQEGRLGPIWVKLVDQEVDEAVADLADLYGAASAAGTGDAPGAPEPGAEAGPGPAGEENAS